MMNVRDLPTQDLSPELSPRDQRYRAYVLFALAVVGFMCSVDKVVITMFVEPIKKEFGLSDTQLGLMTGLAFSLLGGLAAIPLARWADRGNRKWIISGSFVAWTVMTAASGVATNFLQMLAARIGVGIGEAGCIPSTHSMLGDYYPRRLRGRALGIHSAVSYLGMLGGLAGGGLLVQTIGWRSGFVVLGAVGLLLSVAFHLTVREPLRVDDIEPHAAGEHMFKRLGDPRAFLYLVGAFSTASLAGAATMAWLPSYFARAFTQLSPMQVGGGLGLCLGVATAIGSVTGGALSVRYGARSKSWGAAFAVGVQIAVMPFYLGSFHAGTPLLAFGLLFCALFIAGMFLGPVFAMLQDLVKPDARATAVAIVSVAGVVVGQGLGPLIVGAVSDFVATGTAEGLRWAMTWVAMVNWLTVLWFWLLKRRIQALSSV